MTKIFPCKDFEEYAVQRPMNGPVADDYIKIILPYLEKIKGGIALDFGCGDGRYFSFLKKFFTVQNIYGTEVSNKRIENCKKIGWQKVILIKENNKLPFLNDFFDFVNFDQVIEHVSEKDIDFYLNEINRVLKPTGLFIVVTPNYPIKRFYDLLSGLKTMNLKKIKDDPTHIAFYNSKKLHAILVKTYNDVKIIPVGGFLYNLIPHNFFSHKIIAICTNKK